MHVHNVVFRALHFVSQLYIMVHEGKVLSSDEPPERVCLTHIVIQNCRAQQGHLDRSHCASLILMNLQCRI